MMAYWFGDYDSIVAAEALATAEVAGKPEYKNGQEVPANERVTARWAIPVQVVGGWIIEEYPGINPNSVEVVPEVPTEPIIAGFRVHDDGGSYTVTPIQNGFSIEEANG